MPTVLGKRVGRCRLRILLDTTPCLDFRLEWHRGMDRARHSRLSASSHTVCGVAARPCARPRPRPAG